MDVGCSHVPPSRYDHHGIPPRYAGGMNDNTYSGGYASRLIDGLDDLPFVMHNSGPQTTPRARSARPASYHDPHSAGHKAIPRSNTNEPPPSLVPMKSLIDHHPFPRDVQDEQVLRVFMP